MIRVIVDAIALYLLSEGKTHWLPVAHPSYALGRIALRASALKDRTTKRNKYSRYAETYALDSSLCHPVEWFDTFPFTGVVGTANHVGREKYDPSLLTPLEQMAFPPRAYLWRLEDFSPVDPPVFEKQNALLCEVDNATLLSTRRYFLDPQRVHAIYDLLDWMDDEPDPLSPASQQAFRQHPGSEIFQHPFFHAYRKRLVVHLRGRGFVVVRKPVCWRIAFLEIFPDFEP